MTSIGGWTRGPTIAKLLYAGTTKAATASAEAATNSTETTKPSSSSKDVVQISDAAKAASEQLRADAKAPSLKDRVDALFQEARDRGTFITFDSSKGGEWMDMSSFTDDELAQITNDKGGEFPQELSDYAGGTLTARLKVTLEPYENSVGSGDRRAQAKTINKLYEQMSPAVREALNWTPAMMVSNNSMLEGDTKLFGEYDDSAVLANLVDAARRGGLGYSASAIGANKA